MNITTSDMFGLRIIGKYPGTELRIVGKYPGTEAVMAAPPTTIVHVLTSRDDVLVEVRACGPDAPAIVVNKMGNVVLLESDWAELVQTIQNAIDLAKKN